MLFTVTLFKILVLLHSILIIYFERKTNQYI